MGNVKIDQDVHSLDGYSKNEWVDFLKQGAFRGLKINKVARKLKNSKSCIYDKKSHSLELINEKGKTLTLDMAKLLKKNDRWTLSRLIHNIKMNVSTDYSQKFNARISDLAEVITKKTTTNFSLDLKNFVDDQNIDNHTFIDIKAFFNKNLRIINESSGNKEISDDLMKLRNKLFDKTKFNDADSRILGFEIQSIAIGLFPSKEFVWEALPPELQKLIFAEANQSLEKNNIQPLLKVSKNVKNDWINDNDICLMSLGCSNSAEAVNYVIKHKLTSANFLAFDDFRLTHLQLLSENCSKLKKLSFNAEIIVLGDLLAEYIENFPLLDTLRIELDSIFSGDKILKSIENLCFLKHLKLGTSANSGISRVQLDEMLEKLINLESLDLKYFGQSIDDKITESIGKLTKLKSLNISSFARGAAGLDFSVALRNLTGLQSLNISGNANIKFDDQLMETIGTLTQLRSLDLSDCAISHTTGDKLKAALGNLVMLETLRLRGSQIDGNNFPEVFEKLTKLKYLDIGNCLNIPEYKLTEILEKITSIEGLTIGGALEGTLAGVWYGSHKFLKALEKLIFLKTLDIRQCNFSRTIKITKTLKKLTTLQHLSLGFNNLISGDELYELVEKLPLLETLMPPWSVFEGKYAKGHKAILQMCEQWRTT